jgi:conjugal transfer pilus assembly protein TraB
MTETNIEITKKKQLRNLAMIVIAIGCAFSILYFVIADSSKSRKETAVQGEFGSAIKHIDAGSVLIERTEKRLAQAEKATENLQRNVETLNLARQKQAQEMPQEQEAINILNDRLTELEQRLVRSEHSEIVGPTLPSSEADENIHNPSQQSPTTQIREDVIPLTQAENQLIPTKNPKDYVPSGTFVKAVALGGADASAAVNAQSNPQPMLFRIIEDGTMPNKQNSRLKGCLVTAAVVGDISSERGFIRLETLSCIESQTNRVIDLSVEGTVFGPEGKSGIRGIPLWREGALLQRAFAAGALSGLSSGISQKFTKTATSPLGTVQSMSNDVKDILGHGAASGLGNAMEKLADYNIRRAEQYHPVLQLSAGTVVEIVFLRGFYLSENKQNDQHRSNLVEVTSVAERGSMQAMQYLTDQTTKEIQSPNLRK